ncbi:TonB-dependent receptor [Roseateles amylovorans]|uniref:TonB-dependent siderophore receptor n=1 Tax=Roseateles amylovorans TaxID=2978473 RepID=A0ABY6AXF8_9BURK|nr:TonB-dependent siderophore receptor [Roseateles amylovorans]UXH77572.1 TonB-dependent siderophore receptor [Roseateles amylovorans]
MMPPITLTLILAALPAFAQAQTAEPSANLLPVVRISGTSDSASASGLALGTTAAPLNTPFSISRVPADLLRDQAVTSLQDALRNVPGAQADSGFNGSHTQFFLLRGAVSDNGTGSNRVFRDGVRLSNYPYTPAFVESVDVLRGPGAALGVRSEPGGTVNLTTRQPQLKNFGSVLIGAGTANAREFSVDLNRVLSSENELAARLTATRSQSSEWRHVPDRLDGVKLGLAKSDGARYHLRASVEATNQTYQPDYGLPALNGRPVAVPRDRQFGEPFGDSTTRNRIVDLHGDVALDARTRLTAKLTHLEADSTSIKNLLNGSPLANQPAGTWARVSAWEPGTTRRIDSATTSLTRDQTLAGLRHQFYVGLDYYEEFLDQPALSVPASTSPNINVFNPVYGLVTAPANPGSLARSLTTQNLYAFGASLQDQVDLGDWSVVAGVRLDRQHFRYGAATVMPVEESRWSPKIAVLRRLGASDSVYAHLSTGTAPNQVASSTNQSLPSRRSEQAELGWKSQWQDGRLSSDVAVYRLAQNHMISSDTSTPSNFDFNLAGDARSQGVEASLSGRLSGRLNTSLTYAYTEATYGDNAVYGGKRVPNVARHAVNVWGQYDWGQGWKTAANVAVQSRRFADEANTTVLPGYARVDLIQSWTASLEGAQSLALQLALRNLFDKAYDVSSHLHVSRWITPGQGRNVSVTATYQF